MDVAPDTATIVTASRYDPEPFRKQIVDGGGEAFAKGLIEALTPHQGCQLCARPRYATWAYRTFAKVAKLTDSEPLVLVNLFAALGVRDDGELRTLLDSGRRLQSIQADATASVEAMAEEACALLLEVFALKPELRAASLAKLGGNETATNPCALLIPPVNGDANGNGGHP